MLCKTTAAKRPTKIKSRGLKKINSYTDGRTTTRSLHSLTRLDTPDNSIQQSSQHTPYRFYRVRSVAVSSVVSCWCGIFFSSTSTHGMATRRQHSEVSFTTHFHSVTKVLYFIWHELIWLKFFIIDAGIAKMQCRKNNKFDTLIKISLKKKK